MRDTSPEQWLPIVGYEGYYEVSDRGNVRSITRTVECGGRYHKTIQAQMRKQVEIGRKSDRRKAVSLSANNATKLRLVHQLVLEAFVGPRPPGFDGCHNNGAKFDNCLENLRWDTKSRNTRDQLLHGTHHEANRTRCPKNHEYTPANTRVVNGKRRCRTCHRIEEAERHQRKASARPQHLARVLGYQLPAGVLE